MAVKKLLCISWNLELGTPDDQTIRESIMDLIGPNPLHWPNFIVLGVQESNSEQDLGGLLTHRDLLGGLSDPYTVVASAQFQGVTKIGQAFSSEQAAQAIYLLARTSDAGQISAAAAEAHQKGSGSFKAMVGFPNEKGFTFAELTVAGKRIGFVSTHLAAKEDGRAKEIAGIRSFLVKKALESKFSALFMMGDLNYRIKMEGAGATAEGVYAAMTTSQGRASLMALDTFNTTLFSTQLPFLWPGFHHNSLPTYKRHKEESAFDEIRRLVPLISVAGGKAGRLLGDPCDFPVASVRAVYKVKKSDKGPNIWDAGYLDRIGYAVYAPGGYSTKGNPGLLRAGVTLVNTPEVTAWNHIPYGDHVPVFSQFELNGF